MRFRLMAMVMIASLAGCAWLSGPRKYSVFFQPYSADIDFQALGTLHDAAMFAQDHPLQIVKLSGYAAPPAPGHDVDGLSAQRADTVKQVLVADGVPAERITTAANGITDPRQLPDLAVRRVDISFGL